MIPFPAPLGSEVGMLALRYSWSIWFAAALSGCGEPAPVDPAPPPATYVELLPVVPVEGLPLRAELRSNAPPGSRVVLLAGHGPAPAGTCRGARLGVCVDIDRPIVLAEGEVDGAGQALLQVWRSRSQPLGASVRAQAVVALPGRLVVASNVSQAVVVERGGDLDEDGLDNADEALRGLRVWDPDTDGGGTEDAQEVRIDLTDPLGEGDDLPGERLCEDGRDNDGDWELDCDDADCLTRCPERGCHDGADQDLDGLADCDDPDCAGLGAAETCTDGGDDDCDGLADCADPDCAGDLWCTELRCSDGNDDDSDGLFDCWDPDCSASMTCVEIDCSDGFDDDDNGQIDCADADCHRPGRCAERACDDGVDGDLDGLADCEDADCMYTSSCFETNCRDRRDEDADGASDCADEDCWRLPSCHPSVVAWTVTGSTRRERTLGAAAGELWAEDVVGRLRVSGPRVGGEQICTWVLEQASASPGVAARSRVTVDPACRVDESALPPIGSWLWGTAWYGGWDEIHTETVRVGGRRETLEIATAGPALEGGFWGWCEGGLAPVEAWLDEDGDGAGVSGRDRWGAVGGRTLFCGAVPEMYVRTGGDCDDTDTTWSPVLVALAEDASCLDVRDDDRDADGALAGVDRDDRDGQVQ